jgi:diguanylate cyclase
MAEMNPSELARETLKRLAMQRIPPTPDNYRMLYHEIAGTQAAEAFPEKALKALAIALPRQTPEQMRYGRQIDAAIGEGNWESLRAAFVEVMSKSTAPPANWGSLIRDLIAQYETRHAGITAAKKRETLDHVLTASGSSETLFGRLQSLLRSWGQAGSESAPGGAGTAGESEPAGSAPAATGGRALNPELQELLAQIIDNTLAVLIADSPDLHREAEALAAEIRAARSPEQIAAFTARLKKFSYRLQFAAEDQVELKAALIHLLNLIVENISELVIDDQWVQGQVALVRDLLGQPMNLRQLDDVERRMKDLIYKQSALKKSLTDAQQRLKDMLASFVDRLADFASTTGEFHDRIGVCADKVSKARDIGDLSDVLAEVMQETRAVQLAAQRSRDELAEMRARVREAEQEVARLQEELAQTSEMVRVDPLTGALNRKGMDEAIAREVGRARRRHTPTCLAMLDIDNFKRLNDTYGHDVGDQALIHLAQVVREALRPQDTLARYGGEEFVIVLADTRIDDGMQAMVRVQRELTRRFFMHNNDKLLITFSCGVAELDGEEAPEAALKRADSAMYMAKRSGKNRVVAG